VSILNRYILTAFGRIFSLSLAAFVGIYLLVDFFEKVDDFIGNHASFGQYFWYFFNKIPVIAVQVSPLAVLMGVFMTLGGLARSNELTAIRSGGISLWRISVPLLGVSLAIALTVSAANEYLVPLSVKKINYILGTEVKGKTQPVFKRDRLWYREGNNIIFIRLALPEKGMLQGVSIFRLGNNSQLTGRTDAADAVFQSGGTWIFHDLTIRSFDPGTGSVAGVEHLGQKLLNLNKSPADFTWSSRNKGELSLRELSRLAGKLQAEGFDATRYRVDIQNRLAMPFASVIMAFLGIPFALRQGRNAGLAMGVAVSVGIGIAYHIVQAMLVAFGYSAVIPPAVAAWSGHVLFGLLGIWLLLFNRG
jgi:lipopolysaccharide export system permease protein